MGGVEYYVSELLLFTLHTQTFQYVFELSLFTLYTQTFQYVFELLLFTPFTLDTWTPPFQLVLANAFTSPPPCQLV